jgi:poly-beta-1,6-N-acetyl-D-glucosamine biosynthesis protein PgaD
MNTAKSPLPGLLWPPIIKATRVPRWIVTRDILLTLLAWAVLVWLLREPIYVAYDYLRHPIFRLTTANPLDISVLWVRLGYYWITAAVLIALLWSVGLLRRRRLRAATQSAQPLLLTIEEQAQRAGIDEQNIERARAFKFAKARFNDDGNLVGFEELIVATPELK